jgi:hypothetical protein
MIIQLSWRGALLSVLSRSRDHEFRPSACG